jgi:5-methylthioadenosine/S-adenosylhomocysteine deaminase
LIQDGMIITMDNKRRIFEKGSVIIQEDKILDVGKTDTIRKKYRVDQIIEAKNKVVFPGLINTHHHPGLITSTNFGIEKFVLEDFLNDIYYPILEAMTSDHVYWSAMLAYAQAIKGGVTCLNDMYCKTIDRAKAAEDIGIRAILSSEAADLVSGQETIKDNEKAVIEKNGASSGRIKIWLGIEWIPVCSSEFLIKARELADKYKTGIHLHLNESTYEVEFCKKKYGKRPTEHAHDLGLLGPDVVAAHSIWLSDKEINIMKQTATNVAHCPAQNMKTGTGVARVPELLSAGVNVGLGTDAYPDMLETLRCAKMLQHIQKLDATIMPTSEIFDMATTKGAKALGLSSEIGSLQSGKKADIVIVNLHKLRFTPKPTPFKKKFNPLPMLLWSVNNSDIESVIIDGKIIVQNGTFQMIDENMVMEKANEAFQDLKEKIQNK